jgi:hypothetical protein
MIKYEDTSHKTLGLGLASGNIDVSNLSVISTKTVGNIEFGILGASHYVKIHNGPDTLNEIFACRKLNGDVRYYSINDLNNQSINTQNRYFNYEFKVEVIDDKKFIDALIKEFEDADANNYGDSLMELFPTKGEVPFKACTYINVKESEHFTRVQTIHTYPEENTIVYTESKINLK